MDPSGYHTRLWIRGSWVRSRRKNPEYDCLRKESRGSRVVDLRHVKEPAEIRASEENLSDFARSMSEATLMT